MAAKAACARTKDGKRQKRWLAPNHTWLKRHGQSQIIATQDNQVACQSAKPGSTDKLVGQKQLTGKNVPALFVAGLTSSVPVSERRNPQVAEEFMRIIHLVFSNLKTWLRGIPHGVSPQHMQANLNEFTFCFNRRCYPFNVFRSLLGIAGAGTALTCAELYAEKSQTTTSSRVGSQPDRHGLVLHFKLWSIDVMRHVFSRWLPRWAPPWNAA